MKIECSNLIDSIAKLKCKKQWVNWKYQTTDKGKTTKVPYQSSRENKNAKTNDPNTWSTYKEAEQLRKASVFDGIGIMFANNLCGIDIDGVDGHTKENPLQDEIIKMFKGTYIERSPSGSGTHILFTCDISKLPDNYKDVFYMKNEKNGIECYLSGKTNRYFTFTENTIDGCTDIKDMTSELLSFFDRYMRREKPGKKNRSDTAQRAIRESLNADNIIEKLNNSKIGDKFRALFNGDISAYNNDNSAADEALCCLVAFYTDDYNIIEEVWSRSALASREKFDRSDYRKSTIEKALKQVTEKHNPDYRSGAVSVICDEDTGELPEYFYKDDKKKLRVHPALLSEYIRKHDHYFFVRNNANEGVNRYWYKNGVYNNISDAELKGYIKAHISDYAPELIKMNDVIEVFSNLTTDLEFIPSDKINANENIINFRNGLLDINTMTLKPHTPNERSTIQIPCDYDPTATETPVFDKFMNDFTSGNEEKKRFLYQYAAVCLSNIKGSRFKKALFMVGDGNTGKSQLKGLIETLIGGSYCASASIGKLEERFGTSNLYGKRLVGDNDMSFLKVAELRVFKQITGGDSIQVEYKGRTPFQYVFNGLLWYGMNELPRFSGDRGEWVYDRMIILRFDNVIPEKDRDPFLKKKMYAERNAIISKYLIPALQEVIQNGYRFNIPAESAQLIKQYKIDNNPALKFFAECCRLRKAPPSVDDKYTTRNTYEFFKAWCNDNNNGYSIKKAEFKEEAKKYFGIVNNQDFIKTLHGTQYYAFTIKEENRKDYF